MKIKLRHFLLSTLATSSIIGASTSIVACGTTPPPDRKSNNDGFPVANATQQKTWDSLVNIGLEKTKTDSTFGIYTSRPSASVQPGALINTGQFITIGGEWLNSLALNDDPVLGPISTLIGSVSSFSDIQSFVNAGGIINIKFEGALGFPEITDYTDHYYYNNSPSYFSIMLSQNNKPLVKIISTKKLYFLFDIVYDESRPPYFPVKTPIPVQTAFDKAISNAIKSPSKSGISLTKENLTNAIAFTSPSHVQAAYSLYKQIFSSNISDLDALVKTATNNFFLTANDFVTRGNTIFIAFKEIPIQDGLGVATTIHVSNTGNNPNVGVKPYNMYLGLYNGDNISISGMFSTTPFYINIDAKVD